MDPEENEATTPSGGGTTVAERTPVVRSGNTDPVQQQATRIAEAILPQLEPAIQARVDAAVEAMEARTLAAMTQGMGQVASRLRPPAGTTPAAPGPFASFGEQLQAIRAASIPGGHTDPRLAQFTQFTQQERGAVTGSSLGVPADGGLLLQDSFVGTILRTTEQSSLIWERIPANRKITLPPYVTTIKMPGVDETSRATGSRWGGVRVYRVAEGETVTASKPEFKRIALELSKSMGLAYLTNEQVQNTPIMEAIVREAFGDELAFGLDDDCIRGSGVGAPLGALNADALVVVDAEPGQAAGTITFENAQNMWARMPAKSRANAVWFINQDAEPQLQRMALVIGTGGVPVYLPPGGLSGSPYGTLFGRPVIPVEQCSTVGTVGDILLLDMTQYWHIDKGTPNFASSMHVAFLTDEMAYRITYHNDFRPLWSSALTPYQGTNEISPYIALETRD